jgi:hypothetical protein
MHSVAEADDTSRGVEHIDQAIRCRCPQRLNIGEFAPPPPADRHCGTQARTLSQDSERPRRHQVLPIQLFTVHTIQVVRFWANRKLGGLDCY